MMFLKTPLVIDINYTHLAGCFHSFMWLKFLKGQQLVKLASYSNQNWKVNFQPDLYFPPFGESFDACNARAVNAVQTLLYQERNFKFDPNTALKVTWIFPNKVWSSIRWPGFLFYSWISKHLKGPPREGVCLTIRPEGLASNHFVHYSNIMMIDKMTLRVFYTRLWPAFGWQSLVGSSGGYTSHHGYTSH